MLDWGQSSLLDIVLKPNNLEVCLDKNISTQPLNYKNFKALSMKLHHLKVSTILEDQYKRKSLPMKNLTRNYNPKF